MATVTKLPSGKWKAIIRIAGRSKTKTFKLKSAAKAWAENAEKDQELAIALRSPGAALNIRELADEYLDQWSGKDASHPARVNWWVEKIGDKKLINVDAQTIRDLLDKYATDSALSYAGVDARMRARLRQTGKPRKAATINRMQAALSSLYTYARKRGYVSRSPCSDVAGLTENNKIIRWLSDDERARLLVACRNSEWPKLHLLTIMALSTGARLGELQRLRWNMIDFKARTALLTDTKNGSDRVLTLPPSTVRELEKFREVGNGLVFGSEQRRGRPFQFRKYWDRALKEADVKTFRFHDLRHSAASYLAMSGCSLVEIAQVLGHRSIQTTQRYAHLSTEHQRGLTDRILGNLE